MRDFVGMPSLYDCAMEEFGVTLPCFEPLNARLLFPEYFFLFISLFKLLGNFEFLCFQLLCHALFPDEVLYLSHLP